MKFSKYSRVADMIHENHLLLPVINRFGIRLGIGEKDVAQVCRENGVSPDFFLLIINAFNDPDYFPEEKISQAPPSDIVDYLQKTHLYYIDYVMPQIERLLDELVESCEEECQNLRAIKKFYEGFKLEMMNHISEEEDVVFPYVKKLETAGHGDLPQGYAIHDFEQEHNQIDEKLLDLKNIIIKYLPPSYDDNRCNAFLASVFQFERDLKDHARIEDKVLVPVVKALEDMKRK